ncbi:hypothetical protein BGZ74_005373 [Mortierella antarctica]|nr:hypothetical protein BGZ74_005373 [Mortierella antarctica]
MTHPHTQSTTLETPNGFYNLDSDTVQSSMAKDLQPDMAFDRAHPCHVDDAIHSSSNSSASSTSSTFPSSLAKLTHLTRQLSSKHSMSHISLDSGICLPSSSSSEASTPPGTPSVSQLSFNTDTHNSLHLIYNQSQEIEVDNDESADDSSSTHTARPSCTFKTRAVEFSTQDQRIENSETNQDTQTEGSDSNVDEEEDDASCKASKSSEKTFKSVRKFVSGKEQPVYMLYPKTELLGQDASPLTPESPMSDVATPPPSFPYKGRLEYASRYGSDIIPVDPATGRKLNIDDEARLRERLHRKAVLRSKSMSNGKSRRLPNFTPAMTEGRDTEPVEVARIRRMYSTRGHTHNRRRRSTQGKQREKPTQQASTRSEEWVEKHQRYQLSDTPVDIMGDTGDAPPAPAKKGSISRKSSTRKISIRDPERPRALLRKKSRFGIQYEMYRQRRTDEPRPKKAQEAIREETEILTFELALPNVEPAPMPSISITTDGEGDSLNPNDHAPAPRPRRLSFLDPVVVRPRRLSRDSINTNLRRHSRDLSKNRCGARRRSVLFSTRRPSTMSIESTRSSIAHSIYSVFSEDWERPEFYEKSKSSRYPASLQTKIKTRGIEEEEEEKESVSKILDVNDVSAMLAQGIDPNERHPDSEAFYRYHFDYFATHGEFRPDPIDLGASSSISKVESRGSDDEESSASSSPTSPSVSSSGGVFRTIRRVTSKKLLGMKTLKRKKSKDLASNSNNSSSVSSPRLEQIDMIQHELSPNGDGEMDERWMERVPEDERRPGRFDVDWLDAMPL